MRVQNYGKKFGVWPLAVATPLVLATCMTLGAAGIGLPDLHDPTGHTVFMLRLYRVLTGFFVGAGLACAGVVLQALLRNPLAEPYILGVSSGAGLGAAAAILAGLGALHFFSVPASAFLCGCATLILVYLLAAEGGKPSIYGLILSGVIISSICSSFLMFLVAIAPVEGLHSIMWWMLGNLEVGTPSQLATSAALIIAGFFALWSIANALNAMTLGQEMAHHLGVGTTAVIVIGLVCATLITAAAVAVAGLIGFVGLIVPHAMRASVGADHRRLLPASALAGGAFLALCDAAARTIMAPREIPVGVITALLGGPFFLFILRRRRKQGWLG